MRKKNFAFALVEVMLVVATLAILAVFSLPNVIRSRIAENVSGAQVVLKSISTAAENYALAHNAKYPTEITQLIQSSGETGAPYLKENYCDGKPRNGYVFKCNFNLQGQGYALSGRPTKCGLTGDKSFMMTTAGILSQDATCLGASIGK